MSLFVETIRVEGGEAPLLSLHQARLDNTLRACCGTDAPRIDLTGIVNGLAFTLRRMKVRVVYGCNGVTEVTCEQYRLRHIGSLKVVCDDTIDYAFKRTDRRCLQRLTAMRDNCDDVLIVRNGLLTDTSFTNIALLVDGRWLTPAQPLLAGVMRSRLIADGILRESDLTLDDVRRATGIRLTNAMTDWGEMEVLPSRIVP